MIFNRLVIICAVYWNCFRLLSASDTPAAAAFWNKARAFSVSPVSIYHTPRRLSALGCVFP